MFQDAGGIEPVTKDGDPVALIKDKSGNDNHATQPIAASRPIYRTDGNLHWLEFDGVDDDLMSSGLDWVGNDFYYVFSTRRLGGDFVPVTFKADSGNTLEDYGNSTRATERRVTQRFPVVTDIYRSTAVGYPADINLDVQASINSEENYAQIKTVSEGGFSNTDMSDKLAVGYVYSDISVFIGSIRGVSRFSSMRLYGFFYRVGYLSDSQEITISEFISNKSGVTL